MGGRCDHWRRAEGVDAAARHGFQCDQRQGNRSIELEIFNISYGASFGPYAGKYFRIGHLGDINDGMLMGALAITELALAVAGIPHSKGGVQAAVDYLVSAHADSARVAAE